MGCSIKSARSAAVDNKIMDSNNNLLVSEKELMRYDGFIKSYAREHYGKLPEAYSKGSDIVYKKGKKVRFDVNFFDWIDRKNANGERLYQLEGDKELSLNQENIESLNKKLLSLMQENGIEVNYINNFKEKYGIDAYGVADLSKKVIELNNDKASAKTFTEEASHFMIELLGKDHPTVKKLMGMVDQTNYYQENKDAYLEQYDGDVERVKLEMIGKLLKDVLIDNNEKIDTAERNYNKDLWSRFKKFLSTIVKIVGNKFKKLTHQDIDSIVEKEIGSIAKDFLNGNTSQFSYQNLQEREEKLFEIDTEQFGEDFKKLDSLKKQFEEGIKARIKKAKIYEKIGNDEYSEELTKKVNDLFELLENDKISIGVIEYLNTVEGEITSVYTRLYKMLNDKEHYQKHPENTLSALRKMTKFVTANEPILKSIEAELPLLLEPSSEEYKAINDVLLQMTSKLNKITTKYYEEGIPLLAEVFRPYAEKNPDFSMDQLIESLKRADKDMSWTRTFLDAMAEASDETLRIIDRYVKQSLETARLNSIEEINELLEYYENEFDSGDMGFAYEKDSNGVPTGYRMDEYMWGKFEKDKKAVYDKVKRKVRANVKNAPKEDNKLDEFIQYNSEAIKIKKNEYRKFFQNATQPRSDAEIQEIIDEKKRRIFNSIVTETKKDSDAYKRQVELAKNRFDKWYNENTTYDQSGNVYYIKEFTKPSKVYLNPAFNRLTNKQKEFLNKINDIIERHDAQLPVKQQMGMKAPQIRKDMFERAGSKSLKENAKGIRDHFVMQKDDTEFGSSYKLTDENGNSVDMVPVFFTNELDNMKDLSTDMVSGLAAFIKSSNSFKEMNKIKPTMEFALDVFAEREVLTGNKDILAKGRDKAMAALYGEEKEKKGITGGNAYERLNGYYKMVILNQMKDTEESFLEKLGLNTAKTVDAFNTYTSINNLAFNIYANFANVSLGNALTRQEAIAGQFFDNKDLNYADKTYWGNFYSILNDVNRNTTTSKLRLFLQKFDVLNNFNEDVYSLNAGRSAFGRMFNTSALFILNHMGEHQIQSRSALAIANTIKLKDKEGNEINLWDALEVTKNNLVVKEGVTKKDGSPFTTNDIINTSLKMKAVNKRLHGIYNAQDKSLIQRKALGRMAVLFRKFLKPGFNRRWEKRKFNYELDDYVEGYYITALRFLKELVSDMKGGQFSLRARWNELSDHDKANFKRTITDITYVFGTAVLAAFAESLADDADDEDKWALNMTAYQLNRLYTEVFFYANPKETFTILESPAAGVDQLEGLIDIFYSFDPSGPFMEDKSFIRRYKSGSNKGDSYLWVNVKRGVPLVKTLESSLTPEEKLKYYTR